MCGLRLPSFWKERTRASRRIRARTRPSTAESGGGIEFWNSDALFVVVGVFILLFVFANDECPRQPKLEIFSEQFPRWSSSGVSSLRCVRRHSFREFPLVRSRWRARGNEHFLEPKLLVVHTKSSSFLFSLPFQLGANVRPFRAHVVDFRREEIFQSLTSLTSDRRLNRRVNIVCIHCFIAFKCPNFFLNKIKPVLI